MGAVYYADMMEMLPLCDFVMVVCPLTAETKNLFSKPQFDAMKNTAHFINIARGEIFLGISVYFPFQCRKRLKLIWDDN